MTPIQSRMGRAAVGWSILDLARAANVGENTVNRFETGRDARVSTVAKLRVALEAAGVVFIAENGGGVGVRLRNPSAPHQGSKEG